MRRALLVVFAVGAIGCRSAPGHFYTLVPPATAGAPPTAEFQIEILPVDIPADVDRTQLVVRRGRGEVAPQDSRSWIAPLSLELRRAFSDDVGHALGARDVADVTATDGIPTYRIKLAVSRFESILDDHALIDAVWTVREVKGTPLTCSVRASEHAAAGYDGLVEAHQRALARIAAEVAAGVRALRDGKPACPQLAPGA